MTIDPPKQYLPPSRHILNGSEPQHMRPPLLPESRPERELYRDVTPVATMMDSFQRFCNLLSKVLDFQVFWFTSQAEHKGDLVL
jgi:hypothetical protein